MNRKIMKTMDFHKSKQKERLKVLKVDKKKKINLIYFYRQLNQFYQYLWDHIEIVLIIFIFACQNKMYQYQYSDSTDDDSLQSIEQQSLVYQLYNQNLESSMEAQRNENSIIGLFESALRANIQYQPNRKGSLSVSQVTKVMQNSLDLVLFRFKSHIHSYQWQQKIKQFILNINADSQCLHKSIQKQNIYNFMLKKNKNLPLLDDFLREVTYFIWQQLKCAVLESELNVEIIQKKSRIYSQKYSFKSLQKQLEGKMNKQKSSILKHKIRSKSMYIFSRPVQNFKMDTQSIYDFKKIQNPALIFQKSEAQIIQKTFKRQLDKKYLQPEKKKKLQLKKLR